MNCSDFLEILYVHDDRPKPQLIIMVFQGDNQEHECVDEFNVVLFTQRHCEFIMHISNIYLYVVLYMKQLNFHVYAIQ